MSIEIVALICFVFGLNEYKEWKFSKKLSRLIESQKEWQKILGRQIDSVTKLSQKIAVLEITNQRMMEKTIPTSELVKETGIRLKEMVERYELRNRGVENPTEDYDYIEGI